MLARRADRTLLFFTARLAVRFVFAFAFAFAFALVFLAVGLAFTFFLAITFTAGRRGGGRPARRTRRPPRK